MNVRTMAAALAAAGVLGLAACTGQEPTTTAAAAVEPATAPRITDVAQLNPVCTLLDGAQVGARFGGVPASGVENEASQLPNGAEATQCTYVADDSPVAALTVSVGHGGTVPPDVMIAAIREQSGNSEPVQGVGAAALYYTEGAAAILTSANTVGGTPVLVSISGPSSTPRDAYQSLLTSLVSRF